jgi:hypothetical protein
MRPLDEANEIGTDLPVEGFEVQEIKDEDTIRRFMADWRRRVSREYALALLESPPLRDEDLWLRRP